jgi:hypothetical protein
MGIMDAYWEEWKSSIAEGLNFTTEVTEDTVITTTPEVVEKRANGSTYTSLWVRSVVETQRTAAPGNERPPTQRAESLT